MYGISSFTCFICYDPPLQLLIFLEGWTSDACNFIRVSRIPSTCCKARENEREPTSWLMHDPSYGSFVGTLRCIASFWSGQIDVTKKTLLHCQKAILRSGDCKIPANSPSNRTRHIRFANKKFFPGRHLMFILC